MRLPRHVLPSRPFLARKLSTYLSTGCGEGVARPHAFCDRALLHGGSADTRHRSDCEHREAHYATARARNPTVGMKTSHPRNRQKPLRHKGCRSVEAPSEGEDSRVVSRNRRYCVFRGHVVVFADAGGCVGLAPRSLEYPRSVGCTDAPRLPQLGITSP